MKQRERLKFKRYTMHFLAYAYLAFFVAIFSSSNAIVSISASEFIFNEKLQVAVTQSNNNNNNNYEKKCVDI